MAKENETKLLEQLKSGFKKPIKWNKYRSQVTIQNNNNNLTYLIDPTFTSVSRLFVLSFARDNAGNGRDSFSDYYVPKVEIKDFNVLINGKRFFDLPVKNEEEAYEKIMDMSTNNDYTADNLLDFAYFKKNYRLIAIDLSKQTKKILKLILLENSKKIMEQQCFLSSKKNQKKQFLIFHKILPQSYK